MAQVGRSRQLRWSPSAQVEFRASRALKRRKKSSAPWAIAAKWRIPVRWVAEGPLEPGCQGTDSGAYPPRQSHCHRDLGRLVFRLRSDRRRSGREGIAGRQFLHGAWRRCALRGNEGGSRNCLHYRIWSFRYGLRQVRPHAVELFETLLPSSVVAIVPLPLPRGKREGSSPSLSIYCFDERFGAMCEACKSRATQCGIPKTPHRRAVADGPFQFPSPRGKRLRCGLPDSGFR